MLSIEKVVSIFPVSGASAAAQAGGHGALPQRRVRARLFGREQGALHAGVAAAAADVAPRRRAALPLFFNGHEPVRGAGPESALHR